MKWFFCIVTILLVTWVSAYFISLPLLATYESFATDSVVDRNEIPIFITLNKDEQYFLPFQNYPPRLKEIVLKKEDQYFYYHPGVNPFSLLRTMVTGSRTMEFGGSSTITQQLVKILLGNTNDRTLTNKIKETLLALTLEIRLSKQEILIMYLNSVNLGNQAQGFAQASYVYYGKPITELTERDYLSLVATLSSPSTANPWQEENQFLTQRLADKLVVSIHADSNPITRGYNFNSPSNFELTGLLPADCSPVCYTTVDTILTETIRELVKNHTNQTTQQGGTEAAVVVIEIPSNEIITLIGSPDPTSQQSGAQINMAIQPRPVGSTIKPFIFGAAFEHGTRPYSLIDDREYKYEIGTGFPLYPKNFDGTYEGVVTLQSALANSLNTPSIKLLEFISLPTFYQLLSDDMAFTPINPLSSYSYGIALGGLEMDLLTLTHYFTSLAQDGTLSPLSISKNNSLLAPQNTIEKPTKIFEKSTVELLNDILTNREAGVDQFGIRSTLDVFARDVVVKTGTSRDFHDSWAVGYTPDYVVGVWLGNAQNEPMDNLSGAVGAGTLWRQIVELIETTPYSEQTPFLYQETEVYSVNNSLYRGLPDDDITYYQNILVDDSLIYLPHEGDSFLLTPQAAITLVAAQEVTWSVTDTVIGFGQEVFWTPPSPGIYIVTARTNEVTETRTIEVVSDATKVLP